MAEFQRERTRLPCPKCGFLTEADFKFCGACGEPLPGANAYVETDEEPRPFEQPRRSNRSVASLVLGVLAAFPFGLLAGIPAVILGALVLRRRLPGTGFAIAGIALGCAGILITSPLLVLPRLLRTSPELRNAAVRAEMEKVQDALDGYADANSGYYPAPEDDPDAAPDWLPEDMGKNPWTGRAYEYGVDLFYDPAWFRRPDLMHIDRATDLACPYARVAAPGETPGTILVLGHTDPATEDVVEFAVVGFGTDLQEPLTEMVQYEGEAEPTRTYIVFTSAVAEEPVEPETAPAESF